MCSYATLMFGSVLCPRLCLLLPLQRVGQHWKLVRGMAVLALSQPKDSPITAVREAWELGPGIQR